MRSNPFVQLSEYSRTDTYLVAIECTKEGVKFTCQGDIGSGSVHLRHTSNVDKPEKDVTIDLTEPVSLTFSLKYLTNFCKASGLSDKVKLCLSSEVPLLVEYGLSNSSYLRFYLAPKACCPSRSFARSFLTCADRRRGVSTVTSISTSDIQELRGSSALCSCLHLASVWIRVSGMACTKGEKRVVHTSVAKRRVLPHYLFVIACDSDKQSTQHFPNLSSLHIVAHAHMASDTLIPDTRVLAIASHVRQSRVAGRSV